MTDFLRGFWEGFGGLLKLVLILTGIAAGGAAVVIFFLFIGECLGGVLTVIIALLTACICVGITEGRRAYKCGKEYDVKIAECQESIDKDEETLLILEKNRDLNKFEIHRVMDNLAYNRDRMDRLVKGRHNAIYGSDKR